MAKLEAITFIIIFWISLIIMGGAFGMSLVNKEVIVYQNSQVGILQFMWDLLTFEFLPSLWFMTLFMWGINAIMGVSLLLVLRGD